ncbi:unnamed protein product [Allacma fusca]|uniref:Uncharacterized protein n=1 Tax=Allacma fusca TaxID=39272 RepID=A0A8J2PBL5_9HEXA|nr:unnamed protein product [Allacma fusca]
MQAKHLRVVILNQGPLILVKNNTPFGGCYYNILLESSKLYNFTYDLVRPKYKGMVKLPNGTWTGYGGQVFRGEQNLILGNTRTFARNAHFDFPSGLDVSGVKFITALPRKTLDWAAVLYIFQPLTWLCLGLCSFGIFALTYASNYFLSYSNVTTITAKI